MTSAFITQVQPQLQSDPNEETAALLRVLIHKIDNTTFGADTPPLPQWSGPPHTIIQVQAILYASLGASLFSAFLAMLGKQWLNRYTSIDVRGSVIERSQNRQQKLDGIVAWYFDHVLESLPLMLQFALLLLGCALSRYLWEIDMTTVSVVIGVTLFGIASYAFFIVAGTVSDSCPYQTPGAQILRHIPPFTLSALRSASSHSKLIDAFTRYWRTSKISRFSVRNVAKASIVTLLSPIILLAYLVIDVYLLGRAMIRVFVANALRARGLDLQTAALDQRCILWILQTSLDKAVQIPTLKSLATMTTLEDLDHALISACFDILASCVSIVNTKVTILQGLEELAEVSTLCCLRILPHLPSVDPALNIFEDVRQQYTKTFPMQANFSHLPSNHRFCIIHRVFHPHRVKVVLSPDRFSTVYIRQWIEWGGYKPTSAEHFVLNRLAVLEHQRKQCMKVPRWILRYVRHLLSQEILPSAEIVTNCLSMIRMDLGRTTIFIQPSLYRYVCI